MKGNKTIATSAILFLMASISVFAATLSDISGNKNQTAIQYLYDQGVISGYSDGTFQPTRTVNRAELLKILVGGKGENPTSSEYKNCFPDVKEEWFAPYVCYAKEKNWVSGYPDGTFQPAKEVNKVEALKMLINSQGYELPSKISSKLFEDVDNNAWYAPFVAVAKEKGLLEQFSGKYGSSNTMTRGEISENIYRAMIVNEKALTSFNDFQKTLYQVVKVVDGDTIDVKLGNETVRVRLIGVDTPETVHPTKPVQCFGEEASQIAKEKLLNKYVSLESDPTQDDKDTYDRLLRYVFLEDGTNFNKWIIEEGYGFEYTYNLPYKYQDDFESAEKEAMNSDKGLWSQDTCNGDVDTTVEEPSSTVDPSSFICSSNTYNCTDFTTQEEAQSVFDMCLAETGKDIHKLDSDGDGMVCESL